MLIYIVFIEGVKLEGGRGREGWELTWKIQVKQLLSRAVKRAGLTLLRGYWMLVFGLKGS